MLHVYRKIEILGVGPHHHESHTELAARTGDPNLRSPEDQKRDDENLAVTDDDVVAEAPPSVESAEA